MDISQCFAPWWYLVLRKLSHRIFNLSQISLSLLVILYVFSIIIIIDLPLMLITEELIRFQYIYYIAVSSASSALSSGEFFLYRHLQWYAFLGISHKFLVKFSSSICAPKITYHCKFISLSFYLYFRSDMSNRFKVPYDIYFSDHPAFIR